MALNLVDSKDYLWSCPLSRVLSKEKQWLQRHPERAPPHQFQRSKVGLGSTDPGMNRYNLRWMEADSAVGKVTVTGICRVLLALSVDLCWE